MQGRDLPRDGGDDPGDGLAPLHQRGEPPVVGQPAHLDEVLAHLPVGPVHVGDAEVDVRGETPVEFDLTVAGPLPRLPGPVVEEPEIEWLLELVHAAPDEEHHRGVGLADRRVCGFGSVGAGHGVPPR
ncbi:hypothetical protein AIIKEEIJ_05229 [Rhodococcus sp. YH1]|nr:hypothetical protein [Rhodococcus sp. YH1]